MQVKQDSRCPLLAERDFIWNEKMDKKNLNRWSLSSEQPPEDAQVVEIQKKITNAFSLFDHEANKTVDVREVGTIMRALNCCPTEAEINEVVEEMNLEEQESTNYVEFDRFLPVITRVLKEDRYHYASDEELQQAFRVLDTEGKGFLYKGELEKLMTENGEKFNKEEIDEMLTFAVDAETDRIPYRKYAFTLSPIDEI